MEDGAASAPSHEQPLPDDGVKQNLVMVTMRNSLSGKVMIGPEELPGSTTIRDLQLRLPQGFGMQVLLDTRVLTEDHEIGRLAAKQEEQHGAKASASDAMRHLELTTHYDFKHLSVFRPDDTEAIREDDAAVFEELEAKFTVLAEVGSGAYAKVYKALQRNCCPDKLVAIKKLSIDVDEGGVPATAIREVSLVKKLDHPNVAQIQNIYPTSSCLFLVFELMDMDLRRYMKTFGHFTGAEHLRRASYQCCSALHHCHVQRIIHRDLKPQNILLNVETMTLKLADFGLARSFSVPPRHYTPEVVTLWYRAPELLLGQSNCGTSLDIWSMACIIGEMATGRPLFTGDSEIDTLFRIFRVLGTPREEVWQGVRNLPHFQDCFPVWQDTQLSGLAERGPALGPTGIDLLRRCFAYPPQMRLSARRITAHPFFSQAP